MVLNVNSSDIESVPVASSAALGARPRILLVDDHVGFARGLRRYLIAHDRFELVGTVTEGSLVLEQVALTGPDVVVMDAEMSGADGLATTRAIKAANDSVCVILTTLHEESEHHAVARAAGADGMIAKARVGQELLKMIETFELGKSK